jgi:hypothetical protein
LAGTSISSDHGPETKRVRHQRQPDSGIAGGSFDNRAAGFQDAPRHRIPDNIEGGPVLDRLAGIEEFGLAENVAACELGCALKADQRRVANRRDDIRKDHGANLKGPPARFNPWQAPRWDRERRGRPEFAAKATVKLPEIAPIGDDGPREPVTRAA